MGSLLLFYKPIQSKAGTILSVFLVKIAEFVFLRFLARLLIAPEIVPPLSCTRATLSMLPKKLHHKSFFFRLKFFRFGFFLM